MPWIAQYLWLIPVLPLAAAAVIAICRQRRRRLAASLAIGSMAVSFLLAVAALALTLHPRTSEAVWRETFSFSWFEFGATALQLGWVLDPLSACMTVMVTLVSLLIFIFSVGYMQPDENFTRFFGFLSLFAAAMLGLVIANSLLLLFIGWELVGLASYLLIGFWYHKPSAAAAAKKAFITTRIGDLGFLLGMVWWYASSGTLLFYDGGNGCLEASALNLLTAQTTFGGMAVSTAISLLIFCGAMGKSGQVPLHVWLPDAMEGPTPVSALIHAATMVAAGVFLVARVYPLLDANPAQLAGISTALKVIAWVGVITAVFAACIAVAQTDIKRILAYSTISQLGYMMLGIGVGGVAVGMFHLLTHAFFKALLFLGAGSVIHGCQEEQDIRRLGGLKPYMPITFATYAIGMMALAGVPVFFSGFWSKDEILHQAMAWPVSRVPFYLGLIGAFLTAFYMTRQVCYVFGGAYRGGHRDNAAQNLKSKTSEEPSPPPQKHPHESPWVMTAPLIVLAVGALLLGFLGTPVWPWFHDYFNGRHSGVDFSRLREAWPVMAIATLFVVAGLGLGWRFYGGKRIVRAEQADPLEAFLPGVFALLRRKFLVDEGYEATVIRGNAFAAAAMNWLDRHVWETGVLAIGYLTLGLSWASRLFDDYVVNLGFDTGCDRVRKSAKLLSSVQNGQVQSYLRIVAVALALLVLLLAWGGGL